MSPRDPGEAFGPPEPVVGPPPDFLATGGSSSLLIHMEPCRSVLTITPDFVIYSYAPFPNRVRRFFYWLLLGWTWRRP